MMFYLTNGCEFSLPKRFEIVLEERVDEDNEEYVWTKLDRYEFNGDSGCFTVTRIARRNDLWELYAEEYDEISPWEVFSNIFV